MGKDLLINEHNLAKGIYNGLLKRGYVPTSDEVLDIAAVVFDYIIYEAEEQK